MPRTKTNILFPLMSRSHDLNGKLNIGALRETFYKYWNLPRGTVSGSRSHAKFAADRARIMSRANQYYRLRKDAKSELWTTDKPWTYDLRIPQQNREWQKRNWKRNAAERQKGNEVT